NARCEGKVFQIDSSSKRSTSCRSQKRGHGNPHHATCRLQIRYGDCRSVNSSFFESAGQPASPDGGLPLSAPSYGGLGKKYGTGRIRAATHAALASLFGRIL